MKTHSLVSSMSAPTPPPSQNTPPPAASADTAAVAEATKAAAELKLEVARIDKTSPQSDALAMIDEKLAREYRLIPVLLQDKTLTIALADPSVLARPAPAFLQALKQKGYTLKLLITPAPDFEGAIAAYAPAPAPVPSQAKAPEPVLVDKVKPSAPAIKAASPTPTPSPVPASVHSSSVPTVDLTSRVIAKTALEKFPEDVARKYRMVVFELSADGKEAAVAAVQPSDQRIREILKFVETRNKVRVTLHQTSAEGLDVALKGYASTHAPATTPSLTRTQADKIRASAHLPVVSPVGGVSKPEEAGDKAAPTPTPAPAAPQAQPSVDTPKVPTIQMPSATTQAGMDQATLAQIQATQAPVEEGQDLDQLLGGPVTDSATLETVLKSGLVPKMLAGIVSFAANSNASDIHMEGGEDDLRIRYRIDGQLREIVKMPIGLLAPLISRIKILSKLKIDEARLPQDGRFAVQVNGHEVDLRVSTLPTVKGEKCVMRLLDKSSGVKTMEALGLSGQNLHRVSAAIKEPYGIILVTGPTGSGKSTTLYAMLTVLNRTEVNIVTLEDPVEYQLEGINQTQVKPNIGYSFADGLRSILRQDPNVIMVGEIRDAETAELATQAALTGHLVLSTLHTNDAAGSIPRLIDMHVEPFLIASSVNLIIAQRLVRKLCEHCRTPATVPAELLAQLKTELSSSSVAQVKSTADGTLQFFEAKGCDKCQNGYKGRVGIYEVLTMSDSIAQLVIKKAAASDIDVVARKEGMISLKQDGILKALEGATSLDEVLQATSE